MPVEWKKKEDPVYLENYSQAIATAITYSCMRRYMQHDNYTEFLTPTIQISPNRFQCFLYCASEDVLLSTGWDWSPASIVLLWVILHSHLFQEALPDQSKSTFADKAEVMGMRWDLFPLYFSTFNPETAERSRYYPKGKFVPLKPLSHKIE